MYAKIINGLFTAAPRTLNFPHLTIFNPTEAMLREYGYKPVVYAEAPEVPSGYQAECCWVDEENEIRQEWQIVEIPLDANLSADEALSIIMGGAV